LPASDGTGNAEAFKSLERAGWGEKAGSYGLLTGRITARLVDRLLDAAGVAAGSRVLDVGTGPGYAARRAAERDAVVTGVDLADEMVALASRGAGGARFLRADAEALPFPDRSFDAVVGNLVINHLAQPERAAREFARVLAPGGAISLSTWDGPARNRFLGILLDAARDHGIDERRGPGHPDPFRFAAEDELRGLLRGAGFEEVAVDSVWLTQRVGDADELWEGLMGGSVRTAGFVKRQPPEGRDRIRSAVVRMAEEYRTGDGLSIPACAKIARGRQP